MNSASLSSHPLHPAPFTEPPSARSDFSVIGLIGLAHGTSHFFHMLLPPLFPVFIRDFGLSYSQLGLLVTVFFIISGVGQALAGFLVDRVGARPVLFAALCCFVVAALAAASANNYGGLILAAALAGVGNSPFHPADFTILNKRVSAPRLGHAFSVHGISGNLGWAAAPVFLIGLGQITGSWRVAYVCAALVPLLVLALLWTHRDKIDDRQGAWAKDNGAAQTSAAGPTEHPMAFLRLPSVWLCFSFFFWTTAALSAIQSFAGPALARMHGLPLSATAFVVTGYMLFAAAGTVAGGFLVARFQTFEKTIALAMATAACLMLLVASGVLPAMWAGITVAVTGLATGLAAPSRDMLIKRAAPPGATGRVYGTVYSGLDVGFAMAAPVFGYLMDHGQPSSVFLGAAAALVMGVASAGLVGLGVRARGYKLA
jgi:MFS transporter, FSR family, fosmidomycin resistance protein